MPTKVIIYCKFLLILTPLKHKHILMHTYPGMLTLLRHKHILMHIPVLNTRLLVLAMHAITSSNKSIHRSVT